MPTNPPVVEGVSKCGELIAIKKLAGAEKSRVT
jgi:hypothetical protein